jgi:hypothetical protein
MRPGQSRFVTACQQLLVLAAVLAVLTPAANVISLDIVGTPPAAATSTSGSTSTDSTPSGAPAARNLDAGTTVAEVPDHVIDPIVTEYPLTPAAGQRLAPGRGKTQAVGRTATGETRLLSLPVPVTGFGTVGVNWARGPEIPELAARFEIRTRTGDTWSEWVTLPYEPDHAPDPDSREGRRARPGTEPMLVGDVDEVQVREQTSHPLPADMRLAVIDPGAEGATTMQRAAIDTTTLDAPADDSVKQSSDGIALQATTFTPKPQIFSRAQWGADESMRDAPSLHYYEVHAGFVHHTVNANDYTRAEVPALLRGIYAYHVRTRGWSDIGYNFLIDRFGRIWEGRYGGVDRPVVGAHTLNYNDYAFAASAIGNYELVQPSKKLLAAYARLYAWKLSLHGVDAASTHQQVGPTVFEAINGHRDAAATACPGKYLYAKLPQIRQMAAADQQDWSGRQRQTDVASTPQPDLIVRRASDDRILVVPTGGMLHFGLKRGSTGWTADDTVVASPDLDGDGLGDLAVRTADGELTVRPGDGHGGFGAGIKPTQLFDGRDQLAAVGDLDGDGHHDLTARNPATGRLEVFLGNGKGGFTRTALAATWGDYRSITGAGDLDSDGKADVVALTAAGKLLLFPGTGDGRFGDAVTLAGDYTAYARISGFGDVDHDGRPDLVATQAASGRGVVLPARGVGYGHAIGPFNRFRNLAGFSAAEITGSGVSDVVGVRGGRLQVLTNNGAFNVGRPIDSGLSLPDVNLLLNVGDWDRDGFGDLVVRNRLTGVLWLRRGDGDGHFGKRVKIGAGFGSVQLLAAVGDTTGDGFPDLMGQPQGGGMRIYPGAGLSGLKPSYVAYGPIKAGRQLGVGRWDGDGAPDSLFRVGPAMKLYPGNGPGGLVNAARTLSVDLAPYDWTIGDGLVNGGPRPDVIVREKTTGYLWLLRGTANGFAQRRFLGEGFTGYDLVG